MIFWHASPSRRSGPFRRERGYILLFALGLMAVVATLLLSVTVSLRLDAQLLSREKTALQEEYLLQGAARYAVIQLGIASAVTTLMPRPSEASMRNWVLWRPNGSVYDAVLGTTKVLVELEDVSGLPDANMLSSQQWARLFLLLGANSPEKSKVLASKVIELREQLGRLRGTAGFSSIRELLDWEEIPLAMRLGETKEIPQGLKHLMVVGTRNLQVDLNSTPLPLLQVLGNVTDEQLKQLATLRQSGPIAAIDAQHWIQGTGLRAQAPDAQPISIRARLRLASSQPHGMALVAMIASENGEYTVIDQMMDQGPIGR